jgi:Tol biopolymer transport system component
MIVVAQYQPGGPSQIGYLSRDTGETRKITNAPNIFHNDVSLSADSHNLATVQTQYSVDLWAGQLSDANSFRPVTTGGLSAWGTWAPDGKLVYENYAGGNSTWVVKTDGSTKQLTPPSEYRVSCLRVSPNGRYILFASWQTGSPHLWRMDVDGNNPRQLTNSAYDPFLADYTPDSEWLVYTKWGAEKGIWKVPIDGGEPIRLNDVGASFPVVSPDGKMIASWDDSDNVAIMPFSGGPPIKKIVIPRSLALRWTPDSRALLYASTEAGVSNIWSQPIAGGKPKQITRFNNDQINNFDLSRDGSRIVLDRFQSNSDVVLIRDLR